MNGIQTWVRQYIPKKYPKKYGRFMHCHVCSESTLEPDEEDTLVFKHISREDDEYVFLNCPECGQGGIFNKPQSTRGLRLIITSTEVDDD